MPSGLHPTGKNLYQSVQLGPAIQNLIGFTKNTLKFVEIVKTIFQQKGYVASGLKANINLRKVKIAFGS